MKKGGIDNNKTPLTHRVSALAAAYLAGGGFKPIETEVVVGKKWVADLASFVYPTRTEAKKLKLMPRFNSYEAEDRQYAELLYRYDSPLTAIVEVKVDKNDFKKDLTTKFGGMVFPAHLCYLSYPRGMISKDEIPNGWIGLETTAEGKQMYRVYNHLAYNNIHPQRTGDIIDLIANIAIRRDHRTRYAAHRAFFKAYNAEQRERRKITQTESILSALIGWLRGDKDSSYYESIEQLLRNNGIKKTPKYLKEKIEWLESMKLSLTND